MMIRQHYRNPLRPQVCSLTTSPVLCSRQKRDVEVELADRSNVLCRVPVDQFYPHFAIVLAISTKQIRQEARGDGGINADSEAAMLGPADSRDVMCSLA